jgi:amino acid transporter
MFPEAGGPYLYIREAYGPAAGFLFGWAFFWFIMGGGLAALAMGFAEFLGMPPEEHWLFSGRRFKPWASGDLGPPGLFNPFVASRWSII